MIILSCIMMCYDTFSCSGHFLLKTAETLDENKQKSVFLLSGAGGHIYGSVNPCVACNCSPARGNIILVRYKSVRIPQSAATLVGFVQKPYLHLVKNSDFWLILTFFARGITNMFRHARADVYGSLDVPRHILSISVVSGTFRLLLKKRNKHDPKIRWLPARVHVADFGDPESKNSTYSHCCRSGSE